MRHEKQPSLLETSNRWFHRSVAALGVVVIGLVGVAGYDGYKELNSLFDHHLPRIEMTTPNGKAKEDLNTIKTSFVDLSCTEQVDVDVGVKDSSFLKFLGLTIGGAKYQQEIPIDFSYCNNAASQKFSAVTDFKGNTPQTVTIDMSNYRPTNVGVNDLNPLICANVPLNANEQQINQAVKSYQQSLERKHSPQCNGLTTIGIGATNNEAMVVIEQSRQLAVIAGYLTPLSAAQQEQADKTAASILTKNYQDLFRHTKLSKEQFRVEYPPIESPFQQIETGVEAVGNEARSLFGNNARFEEQGTDTDFIISGDRLDGEIIIQDKLSAEQITALNSLYRSL